jgi:hypothetical protein
MSAVDNQPLVADESENVRHLESPLMTFFDKMQFQGP